MRSSCFGGNEASVNCQCRIHCQPASACGDPVWHVHQIKCLTGPELTAAYIRPAAALRFPRTYSARIYFIVSNSSLACLHMPHPSYPADDIRAHSFDREHGLPLRRSRGRLVFVSHGRLRLGDAGASELSVRLMDTILSVACNVKTADPE